MGKGEAGTKVWLVTGCSTGFGRAIASCLIERGEQVVITARRPETLADLVTGHEDRTMALALDITSDASIEQALAAARARFGRIDVLVNNAGYGDMGTVEETPIDVAREIMETNYFGTIAITRGVITEMRERGSGQIVNVGSVAGQIGFAGLAYYCASKSAMAALSEALASELRPFGIFVTLAELGPFATDFTRNMKINPPASHYDLAAIAKTAGNGGWGAGDDPLLGAAALLAAADAAEPPVRLVLGEPGLAVTGLHIDRRTEERAQWMSVSMLREPAET